MKFKPCRPLLLPRHPFLQRPLPLSRHTFRRGRHAARFSSNAGGSQAPNDNFLLIPGATVATLIMLGVLHGRRMYNDKKVEEMREKGIEPEFSPDAKAAFLKLLPLRSMSRFWGLLTSMEIPVPIRPFVYKAWSRAFHTNMEEVALPLEDYASLQEFFVHKLKEGSRTIDPDPNALVSPVDGKIMRLGELRGSGAMIEQVKGFSYSAYALLGANSSLHQAANEDEEHSHQITSGDSNEKSWWHISLASPKVRNPTTCPKKGIFYCVIYLAPGDYHRVHSPVDWQVQVRRHFSGHLFPVNERAARTIRNLHIENERVVLEGQWKEGFLALAAVGATNIGSINLMLEPELRTNRPKKLIQSQRPDERVYEPEGVGLIVKRGEEVAAFNMGSTVVLVFQAPIQDSTGNAGASSDFKFSVKRGDRIRVGEAIGRWT